MTNSVKWTTRDLAALPDDGGCNRYEIIDGELFVTRAPHIGHQDAIGQLYFALLAWSRQSGLGKPIQAPGLVFSPNDAVIPDLVWASQACLASGIDESGHFSTAPELVVEVLSAGGQNQQRDRDIKLKLYSLFGVQEYWILNWQLQTAEIYQRQALSLQLSSTLSATNSLTSPLLPGFSLLLSEVFS